MTDCLKQKNPTDLSAELKCDECIVVCDVEYEQLQADKGRLEERVKFLEKASDQDAVKDGKMFADLEAAQADKEKLEAECKRLRTALKFYADEENYGLIRKVEGRYGSQWATEIEIDEGKNAKEALKESEDE